MTTQPSPKPKKRRRVRRSKNSRNYFTKVHEDAIIEYNNSDDHDRREELYRTLIQPTFSEMVDKIVFTYRFTTLPNIDTDKSAAMSFTWIALNTFLLLNAFVKCGSFLRIYNQWGTLVILIL